MAQGNLAQARGMNTEGMRRRGYSAVLISQLRDAYKIVFRQGHRLEEAVTLLEALPEQSQELSWFIDSLKESQRGIVR
jgi:UDP-N-acetylglucosamine acyltransferase